VWQAIPNGLSALHFDLQSNTDYDLFLRYKIQPETINHYLIIIKQYWWQSILFRIIAAVVGISLIVLAVFYFYKKRTTVIKTTGRNREDNIKFESYSWTTQSTFHL